jgi:exonuclease SbcD
VVDLDPVGGADVTELTVPVGRPVAELTGPIDDLLHDRRHTPLEQHFVRAILTDPGHVTDAKAKLLHRFPYVAEIVLRPPAASTAPHGDADPTRRARLAPIDAAIAFWADVAGTGPTTAEHEVLTRVLDEAQATVGAP